MRLVGYYHLTLINHWFDIFSEQIAMIVNAGLMSELSALNVGVIDTELPPYDFEYWNYDPTSKNKLLEFVNLYSKVNLTFYDVNHNEKMTFISMYDNAVNEEPHKMLYFHCKGVTHRPDSNYIVAWRNCMNYFVLDRWKDAVNALDVYDTAGPLQLDVPEYPLHYTGNFWWSNSQYIATLNVPDELRKSLPSGSWRWTPELLLCSASPKERHFNMFDTHGRKPEQREILLTEELYK